MTKLDAIRLFLLLDFQVNHQVHFENDCLNGGYTHFYAEKLGVKDKKGAILITYKKNTANRI